MRPALARLLNSKDTPTTLVRLSMTYTYATRQSAAQSQDLLTSHGRDVQPVPLPQPESCTLQTGICSIRTERQQRAVSEATRIVTRSVRATKPLRRFALLPQPFYSKDLLPHGKLVSF